MRFGIVFPLKCPTQRNLTKVAAFTLKAAASPVPEKYSAMNSDVHIKKEIENINSVWSAKSSNMYANSTEGTEPPVQEAAESKSSSKKKDDKKIEDADFEVVDE